MAAHCAESSATWHQLRLGVASVSVCVVAIISPGLHDRQEQATCRPPLGLSSWRTGDAKRRLTSHNRCAKKFAACKPMVRVYTGFVSSMSQPTWIQACVRAGFSFSIVVLSRPLPSASVLHFAQSCMLQFRRQIPSFPLTLCYVTSRS